MSQHCSISAPPTVQDGKVVLIVVHDPTGEAFRCELTSFDDVVVSLVPRDLTPSSEGDARGEAAQAAVRHARENEEQFEHLFAQL
jgi:hypothetical protein